MNIFECRVVKGKDGKLFGTKRGKFVSISKEEKEFLFKRQEYFKVLKERIRINGFDEVDCGRTY